MRAVRAVCGWYSGVRVRCASDEECLRCASGVRAVCGRCEDSVIAVFRSACGVAAIMSADGVPAASRRANGQ